MTEYDSLHEMFISIGNGDLEIFEVFCKKMRQPLVKFVLNSFGSVLTEMDAEDIVQDVFIKVKLEASKYRGDNRDASAKKWLFTMTRNHAARTASISSRLPDSFDGWFETENSVESTSALHQRPFIRQASRGGSNRPVEEHVEMKSFLEGLFSKVRDFTPEERNILILRYVDHLKLHEIGELIGKTKARVSQIIDSLHARIRSSTGVDLNNV
ncbi:MAG: sigma-70 family RNA polymerase sigma factor [Anaerolineales bacterium]|nr:sigma-70 family RNA polymerase sigma factor [Anaerolineales bacterium]